MPSEHTQVEELSSLNRQLPSYNPDHPLTLSYVKGIADAYFPGETIGEAFSRTVRKHPDRSRPSRWCNFGCGRGPSSGGFGGDV